MAKLVGCITTSHVPMISRAVHENLQQDPYWKPFFDAFAPLHDWLATVRPDVMIILYNDHGLNFFLDTRPAFAIGTAVEHANGDEGFGPPPERHFAGDAPFAWHIAESLVEEEFDIATCQEIVLDHACVTAGDLLYPGQDSWPIPMIPVEINIVQHPLPKPRRCFALGQAIGRAIASWPGDQKVVIVASGGLSHQISQAGHINRAFDAMCMDKIVNDPEALTGYSNLEWIDLAGAQGLEFMTWLAMRGAILGDVRLSASTYHAPLSHTGGAVMLLDCRSEAVTARDPAPAESD